MSASSARWTGSLNALRSTSETAMPSTFELIALLNALTLVDVRALGAGPLVAAVEQAAGVLGAIPGRDEEGVRRHVVDEREPHLLLLAEDVAGALALGAGTVVVVAAQVAGGHQVGSDAGRASRQSGTAADPTPPLPLRPL